MARYFDGGWAPYVTVAERKRQAQQKMAALAKKGQICRPVSITGRAIAKSFWGKAWCDNLESYSDYANRLPRGRTYVRNGSVIDLRVETGRVLARVSGSSVYDVAIEVQPLAAPKWKAIVKECSGKVASLVELLQGKFSKAVMETVTRHGEGLFPRPREITLNCSCPDSATMCKHVAATLYGVGSRLDDEPDLLFRLRHVDPQDLIRQAGQAPAGVSAKMPHTLGGADLSALFGIDIDDAPPAAAGSTIRSKPAKTMPAPRSLSTATALNAKTSSGTRRSRTKSVTAADLIARGVARHMIQSWLASGVLLPSGERGIYRTTAQTEERISAYVARRG